MDIGEEQRIIEVEPEPIKVPVEEPAEAEPSGWGSPPPVRPPNRP